MKKIRINIKRNFLSKVNNKLQIQLGRFNNKKYFLNTEELANLRFFQFKPETTDLFFRNFNKTDILISDTPHFRLAKGIVSGNQTEIIKATESYKDYLRASWKTEDAQRINNRVNEYKKLISSIIQNGFNSNLVSIVKLPGKNGAFVLNGNHRSAIALALNKMLKVEEYSFDLAFRKYCSDDSYYGSGNKNRPYQSIFFNQQEILPGRRRDSIERIKLIPEKCLKGMKVLDIASNYGMSSILAKKMGAAECFGLEYLDSPLTLSSRFAMIDDVYPEVRFQKFDLDNQFLGSEYQFDTVFMFSIY